MHKRALQRDGVLHENLFKKTLSLGKSGWGKRRLKSFEDIDNV